jgi:AraC-like DNA-binding protein
MVAPPHTAARTPLVVAFGFDNYERDADAFGFRDLVIVHCTDSTQLRSIVAREGAPSAFLCRLEPTRIKHILAQLHHVVQRYPEIPVLLSTSARDGIAIANILAGLRVGASRVVLDETDHLAQSLRDAVEDARIAPVCADTAHVVGSRIPAPARPVLEFCIMNVRRPLTVIDVAHALNVHPRSLHRRMQRVGLPAPSAAISWSRLFVAVGLLSQRTKSVEQVALDLRFTSGSGLRNMLKRYSGLTPSQLRQPGGLHRMATIFATTQHV